MFEKVKLEANLSNGRGTCEESPLWENMSLYKLSMRSLLLARRFEHLLALRRGRFLQGRLVLGVCFARVRLGGQQSRDDLGVPALGRPMQRRAAVARLLVHVGAGLEEVLDNA